ncbi:MULTISPECIES: ABC transporter substrate-binding protein [Mesorhizobium]|uniref:Glycine betaine/proline transport system substrate-binding protein n=1 Tax=Mesorhizobium shonense TaxID=1209948 RepID=A0ABV2HR72_9HYPH|nr:MULTISPECIES: ABC transporter substrate-binding protein [unclassified Mesorhizobium]AZO30061.1 ABC transporter substrate-binding protein [Mesorhizobium sp. M1B.F.Ca.ET.045.04.1.1]AZO30681.1 ABC transporter substrate-binding protein [Mesorhizobium sp. M1B.F.Ca.ET.045.04.1.1]RWB22083.1 MAG: ABC transporter substrate-binding protein [Mesorhizobium sp.]RWD98208.1 MAG: ABC transporter substrate-binding protein [Mesorhizobium sp.]TIS48437.1 MAG: ABC transporter substrate-binding protein [Mesorhiz
MKSLLAAIGMIGASFLAGASPASAACGTVTITEMNWASAAVVTAVSSFLMEQGYGCTVKKVPTSTVPALTSLAETGQPDILTEVWPGVADIYYKLEKEGKIVKVGDVLTDGGIDAWWIPDYLAAAHPELKTLDGILANPKLVGGRFNNCPVGTGCRHSNDNLVKAFELEKHGIEIFNHGSLETLATSIASAYAAKEPWFGYYWAPTSVLGKYKMVQVDMGPVDKDKAKCNATADCATPGKTGWPKATVMTTMSKDFHDKNPELVALMSKVSFNNDTMNELLAWQEENKATADETAVHFLTKYKDVWPNWLSEDAKAKVTAVVQ